MLDESIRVLDILGTAVFAVTGALAAGRKRMDLFGVVVLATVTAVGGGTLRDVILGAHPLFWVADRAYLVVSAVAAIMAFYVVRFWRLPDHLLLVLDALGLAVFTVIGIRKAGAYGASPLIAAVMGMMTGVAGGMIRDVLANEIPLILCREIYATASLCGALVYFGVAYVASPVVAVPAAILTTFLLRLAAIRWNLALPHFPGADGNDGPTDANTSHNRRPVI